MPVRAAIIAVLLLAPGIVHAQATSLRGTFQDATTRAVVSGVQVKLTNFADTADVHRVTAGDDGSFQVLGLGAHSYRLEATRLGYAPLTIVMRVTKKNQDTGVLAMTPESIPVGGVTVTESPPPAVQRGDTTEYRAGAVKVHKDASAEDLVQKLPGVTMEGGQIRAHGENVQNVLVNGRPFFGSDPTAAMRNLPAEVVDKIQVYDRMSDQAEFSGFDDGQSQKTMNFILRDVKAKFGKVYGGYGDQDRYQAGGSATLLRGPTRLTAIAMSNNINQRNFSLQDLFGGLTGMGGTGGGRGPRIMMFGGGFRPGGGGDRMHVRTFGGGAFDPSTFLVGQESGVSTTHSGGLNYVGQWGKRLAVSSSLFANDIDNENAQTLTRQYLPPQDSIAFYDQRQISDSRNKNPRFDARVEWTPDSLNSAILQPRLYFQRNRGSTLGDAVNSTDQGSAQSAAHSESFDAVDGNNLSSRLTLRHRFGTPGRNVSAEINVGHILRDGDGSQRSLTDFYSRGGTTHDTLDQQTTSRTITNSLATRIAFTEPIAKSLRLQAIYSPSLTKSDADARALSLDPLTGVYSLPDSALSNSYRSRHTVQSGGLAMLYAFGPWKLLGNASWQRATLRSEQTFPFAQTVERSFEDVLPSLTLSGSFANRRNVRLAWSTSTTAPTIGQLQNVVNNANPLSLTTGNPDLRPTYTHSLSLRITEANAMLSRSRFLFANVSRTTRSIGNATFTAPTDTTVDGVFLPRGTQLTRPENLGDSWNANLFAVTSRPLGFMKTILNLNGGGSLTHTPTRIGGRDNRNRTYAIRSGVVLASNVSQNLDFTLSYWGTYNISRNTLSTSNTGDYFTHTAGLRFNAVVAHGIVVREEVNHNLQSGVPSAYGQDIVLWNTTLGKKFLKGDQGELRVTATDVLRKNRSVTRSITETYVQDSRDRALGRFVQAVFTYTFR